MPIVEENELTIKRVEVKKRIAKARLWNAELERMRQELRATIDRSEHQWPEQFEQQVRPTQDELEAIKESELSNGEPDGAMEARRRELREQIDTHAKELEERIETERKAEVRLVREMQEFSKDIRSNVIATMEKELADLVSPERKRQHHAQQQFTKVLRQWTRDTEKTLAALKSEIERPKEDFSDRTLDRLRGRLPRIEAELALANETLAATQAKADAMWKSFLED